LVIQARVKNPSLASSGEQDWPPTADSQTPESSEPLPDWPTQKESDSLDWLQQELVQPAAEAQTGITPKPLDELAEEEELPSWLFQSADEAQTGITPEPLEEVSAQEELPSWLFEAADEVDATTATGETEFIDAPDLETAGSPLKSRRCLQICRQMRSSPSMG